MSCEVSQLRFPQRKWKWQSNDYLYASSIKSISSIYEKNIFSFPHMSCGGNNLGFPIDTKKKTHTFSELPSKEHVCY